MKKISLGLGLLAMTLIIMGTSATEAFAYRGDPNVQGPNCTSERHEAMEEAFANRDYNAWSELMQGRGRVTELINEGNFARFAQAHDLALQGNITEAQNIRQELGLGLGNGAGSGWRNRANR